MILRDKPVISEVVLSQSHSLTYKQSHSIYFEANNNQVKYHFIGFDSILFLNFQEITFLNLSVAVRRPTVGRQRGAVRGGERWRRFLA
jgi:hypothetical protein